MDKTLQERILTDGDAEDVTDKPDLGKCPECGNNLITKQGTYGDFVACSGYPKCKYKPPKNSKKTSDTEPAPNYSPVPDGNPQDDVYPTPEASEQQINLTDDIDWERKHRKSFSRRWTG